MKRIVQIVPRLPPAVCGVGDYATILAGALKDRHQIDSHFIVCDPHWEAPGKASEFSFVHATEHKAGALVCLLNEHAEAVGALVLQYSGYGFAKHGAPLWLLAGLKRFRRLQPRVPLITMFHELYATGPVYRSSFWLSWVQRWITRSLARLSDHVHTNRTASAQWLGQSDDALKGRIVVLPVFSNLGECPEAPSPSRRPRHLVVFGHQLPDPADFLIKLQPLARELQAERVIILTRKISPPDGWPPGIALESHGFLGAREISAILQSARWGCVTYPSAFLGKSGVFAAMTAHGVVPILFDDTLPISEGLEPGVQVATAHDLTTLTDAVVLDRISRAGLRWYAGHDIATTAARYASHARVMARA